MTNGYAGTVLLVGDSRVAEWDFVPPWKMRGGNAGIRRATTAQVLGTVPGLLNQFKPEVVVIEAGINDLKRLGVESGRSEEIVGQAFTNITDMVIQSRAQHCRVVLLLVWPADKPDWERWIVWSAAVPQGVRKLNERLTTLGGREHDLQVVDLFAAAGIQVGPGTYRDTLHLKPETYKRLSAALTEILAEDAPSPVKSGN